jgi:phospholipid:diacylglycerol acyltransferase
MNTSKSMMSHYLQNIMHLSNDDGDGGDDRGTPTSEEGGRRNDDSTQPASTTITNNSTATTTTTPTSVDPQEEQSTTACNEEGPPRVVQTLAEEGNDDVDVASSGDESTTDVSNSTMNTTNLIATKKIRRRVIYGLALLTLGLGLGIIIVAPQIEYDVSSMEPLKAPSWLLEAQSSQRRASPRERRPGYQLASQKGATAKYPVVLVHGFVTSGLEVWQGEPCLPFRSRVWAATYGARSFLQDRECWRRHMSLNATTGGDPAGKALRAAAGVTAIDYFLANYWVFAKMIENLADLGYMPGSNLIVETYDWRLSFDMLERRDVFFTNLQYRIEAIVESQGGRKVVLTSHSMGAQVVHYFFNFVTITKSQPDWVDRHIHAFVNIAGSHLGVPKAVTTLLSGDLSDVIGLPVTLVESFFGRKVRKEMWNTWGSIWMMLPKAPAQIWGTGADMCRGETSSNNNNSSTSSNNKTDAFCLENVESPLLVMSDVYNETVHRVVSSQEDLDNSKHDLSSIEKEFVQRESHKTREALDFVKSHGGGYGSKLRNAADYSYHDQDLPSDKSSSRTWHDATRTPLPYAPKMKIYCLYGVGIETERAYYYRRNIFHEDNETYLDDPPVILDHTIQDPDQNVYTGIRYVDGDGSVPLVSLGYLCADAWQRKSSGLNPSGAKVYTREYLHKKEFVVDDPVRGGPHSADHVDILGNEDMLADLVRIVSGVDEESVQENHIVSDIKEISAAINAKGGIFAKPREDNQWHHGLFGFWGRK